MIGGELDRACRDLQDLAISNGVDVDLECAR
jgi:hypothetical protein